MRLFSQNLKDFISSKVNIGAMTVMAVVTYMFFARYITFAEYLSIVTPALSAMGLRDTLFLLKK